MVKDLGPEQRVFRSSDTYQLVLADRLSAAERKALGELVDEPSMYGILRPAPGTPGTTGTVKTVDTDTALLLLTLREAGPLPAFVRRSGEPSVVAERITDLVLDGVLEIEHRGAFRSGAAALPALGLADVEHDASGGDVLARLAHEALRIGQALGLEDIEPLAAWLYDYNALPVTARWQRRLPGRRAVASFLGADDPTRMRGWHASPPRGPDDWIGWTRAGIDARHGRSEPTFKLYVSPRPDAVPSVFGVLVDTLAAGHAFAFKTGGSAAGLLRSDKMVAYFDSFEALHETAQRLAVRLAGTPVQGVPFTATIAADGLLSWGMDPPDAEAILAWQVKESWRLWVARRLAAALIAGRASAGEAAEPWRFALERLRRRGVDVKRWQPSPELWRRSA